MSTTFGYVFSKPKELIQDLWATLKPQQEPRSAGLLSALRQSRAFQAIIVILVIFTGRNTWASFQWIRCRTSTAYDVIFYRILIWQKSGSFLCQHLSLVKLAQWLSLIMARSEEYVQKLEQVGFAIPRVYVYNNTFLAFCQTQITIHPSSHFKPFHTFTLYQKNEIFLEIFQWKVTSEWLATCHFFVWRPQRWTLLNVHSHVRLASRPSSSQWMPLSWAVVRRIWGGAELPCCAQSKKTCVRISLF